MSKDDPKKHRVDRRFLSGQPHEIAYVRRKLARENPGRDPADIERMIHAVRALVAPSESRAYFMLVCRLALNPPAPPARPGKPRKRHPAK